MAVKKKHAVTCFLEHEGKILILKRSQLVGSYRGRWGAVAGYVEPDETPEKTAKKEVWEETGIKDAKLVAQGKPYEFTDSNLQVTWVIHPFRFRVRNKEVKLDWEHEEFRWISPEEMEKFDTVPHLGETWKRVSTPMRFHRKPGT